MKNEHQLKRDIHIDQMEASLLEDFNEVFSECKSVVFPPTEPTVLSDNMMKLLAYGLSKLSQAKHG